MPTATLNRPDAAEGSSPQPPGRRLALIASDGETRIELEGAPQTIGGGPRCTVRLDAPDLRPLHCVITPTDRGPVVRRWSEGTILNGQAFDEAPLAAGDVLRVGGVTLRVVEAEGRTQDFAAPEPTAPAPVGAASSSPAETAGRPSGAGVEASPRSEFEALAPPAPGASADPGAGEPSSDGSADLLGGDPAIPSRLLKPWSPSQPAPVSVSGGAALESAVELAAIVAPEESVPTRSTSAPSSEARPDVSWRVAPPEESVAPLFDENAAAVFGAEADAAAFAEPSPALVDRPAEKPTEVSATWRARLAASRQRVAELVATIRRERQTLEAWSQAVAERDAVIIELHERLAGAIRPVDPTPAPPVFADERMLVAGRELQEEPARGEGVIDTGASGADPFDRPADAWIEGSEEFSSRHDEAPAGSVWGDSVGGSEPARDADEPEWGIERLASIVEAGDEPSAEPAGAPAEMGAQLGGEGWSDEADEADVLGPETDPFGADQLEAEHPDAATPVDPFPSPLEAASQGDDPDAARAPFEAASYIDRFRGLIPEDNESPTPVASPAAAASAPRGSGDDDESIDDYMRKMMSRIRGEEAAPAVVASPVKAQPRVDESVPDEEPAAPATAPIRDLSEIRRSPTPEARADIGALRQLANQSARQAIDVASTRQSRERAGLRMVASTVTLACGALAAITAASPLDAQFGLGLGATVGGGWFAVRMLRACQSTGSLLEDADASTGAARD